VQLEAQFVSGNWVKLSVPIATYNWMCQLCNKPVQREVLCKLCTNETDVGNCKRHNCEFPTAEWDRCCLSRIEFRVGVDMCTFHFMNISLPVGAL